MENNQQSFWQFSDQLRLHTSNLSNLSLNNDSIWSASYINKRTDDRRNFDIRLGGDLNADDCFYSAKASPFSPNNNSITNADLNLDLEGWKTTGITGAGGSGSHSTINLPLNGRFNKGIYSKPADPNHMNAFNANVNNVNIKGFKGIAGNKGGLNLDLLYKAGSNNGNNNHNLNHKKIKSSGVNKKSVVGESDNNNNNDKDLKGASEKRFKTLPASESLPRNETIGGYIFVCNNDTMQENLKRQLFGLPPRYRDSVRAITPGLPLFLYNYSTHQLHGIFEAASFGGSNIDPLAWEDKKNLGESRFPAQVRVITRKTCEPLEEDSFRPILHHYDGPKFRLELNVPEAISLLDIFADQDSPILIE